MEERKDVGRQSQISEQFTYIDRSIGELAKLISVLISDLKPILKEAVEEKKAEIQAKDETLIPLALSLKETRGKINRQVERLQSLISRIEL